MTCEEFSTAGLNLESFPEDDPLTQAAREHLRNCPHCAALHENWQMLRADLHRIGSDTAQAEAPARVEMRLRQNFRTEHKTMKTHRAAILAAWSLAAAAALVAAVSWWTWHPGPTPGVARNEPGPQVTTPLANPDNSAGVAAASGVDLGDVLTASNSSEDFTLLPGSMPSPAEDATIVHVAMQRGALGALGLTVNEEHANDWIQVDLLVGDDGLPQAVRLPQTNQ